MQHVEIEEEMKVAQHEEIKEEVIEEIYEGQEEEIKEEAKEDHSIALSELSGITDNNISEKDQGEQDIGPHLIGN